MVSLRRMAQQCLLLLLIVLAITTGVHSQPGFDTNGFLSIDCGLSGTSSYVDSTNKLTYYSDDNFTDTGYNSKVSSSYVTDYTIKEYLTVRSFPNGTRNCYTIRSLTNGSNYLIRATFFYANYDNLNKPPVFDIYLGVNFWYTVNESLLSFSEIIANATADFLDVCLVNKDQGVPFISSLHIRKFKEGMYSYVDSETSLILVDRFNMGGDSSLLRYPEDNFDRWWWNYTESGWNTISFNSNNITIYPDFQVPPAVLKTAVTTSSTLEPLTFLWNTDDSSTTYYFILHFFDTEPITGRREFNIFVNGINSFDEPLISDLMIWTSHKRSGDSNYNVSLVATSNSTLPPLLNAFELYISSLVGDSTYAEDVVAINSVKGHYKINKGWNGDPCLPTQFLWTGINCSTDPSSTTRITSLDLASSHLTGSISDSIGDLTALQYLYLAYNNLSGSLPTSLDGLTSLKLLDIRGNPLNSTILPPVLESRRKSGFLTYMYGGFSPPPPPSPPLSPPLSPPAPPSPTPKNIVVIIAIAVVVVLLVIAAAVAIVLVLKRVKRKQPIVPSQSIDQPSPEQNDPASYNANVPQPVNPIGEPHWEGAEQIFPNLEDHTFSYSDIKRITNDLRDKIGKGGYGSVYLGYLSNGNKVAVKILSQTSKQGVKEFLAEAENLARVHHKSLVSLVGYCTDKNCMALVYEYMQQGNLRDKIKDKEAPLSWKIRLQIAYESALGLEYLHTACNPPLIHRDVKTSNILLNANLEARIADFGLSRPFHNGMASYVSTKIVGSIGYLDPEYYLSNKPSLKSDVFSFGVVLLEIITGRDPTDAGIGGNLVQWVRHKLSGGDIESIVDSKMQKNYDINSVWKVTDLACKSTQLASSMRPTMSTVVVELKESLNLEFSMDQVHANFQTDESLNSSIEMEYMRGRPMAGPNLR